MSNRWPTPTVGDPRPRAVSAPFLGALLFPPPPPPDDTLVFVCYNAPTSAYFGGSCMVDRWKSFSELVVALAALAAAILHVVKAIEKLGE